MKILTILFGLSFFASIGFASSTELGDDLPVAAENNQPIMMVQIVDLISEHKEPTAFGMMKWGTGPMLYKVKIVKRFNFDTLSEELKGGDVYKHLTENDTIEVVFMDTSGGSVKEINRVHSSHLAWHDFEASFEKHLGKKLSPNYYPFFHDQTMILLDMTIYMEGRLFLKNEDGSLKAPMFYDVSVAALNPTARSYQVAVDTLIKLKAQ